MELITERFICIFIITTIVAGTIRADPGFCKGWWGGGGGGHFITCYYTSGTSINIELYHNNFVLHAS